MPHFSCKLFKYFIDFTHSESFPGTYMFSFPLVISLSENIIKWKIISLENGKLLNCLLHMMPSGMSQSFIQNEYVILRIKHLFQVEG